MGDRGQAMQHRTIPKMNGMVPDLLQVVIRLAMPG